MALLAQQLDVQMMPEKVKLAEQMIQSDPYNVEAWNILIKDAQNKKMDEARVTFERLITQFPTSGIFWKRYIEAEMKARNFERVEKLFQRSLMKVMHIELWKCYLSYVRDTKSNLPSYREKMAQAYDFALEKMGMDCMSFPIWIDYVNFLKGVEAVGSYAENQRIAAVRKVYQRGVISPMIGVEGFWKSYCEYENNINPIIAKKMIDDRSRDYTNARRVSKEIDQLNKDLKRNAPACPPTGTLDDIKQVEAWKKYITWEKNNPLRTEEQAIIVKRVVFAYEQCLLCLGHHADIWFEAASYLESSAKQLIEKGDMNSGKVLLDEAATYFERPIQSLLSKNQFLYFSYADFEENRLKPDKAHQIYQKLIDNPETDPTLVYIQYMKFARRAEGIKSARQVFKKAREDQRCQWHVFVSASLMEYYCSKDKNVAFKIFELGLKKYSHEGEYVKQYIDYLCHQNEDNNTRVLFERVLNSGTLPLEQSLDIWEQFLQFECETGDLSSIVKVEKRRLQALEKLEECQHRETALVVDRYRYLNLMPSSTLELKSMGYKFKSHPKDSSTSEKNAKGDEEESVGNKKSIYTPSLDSMLPFQPKRHAPTDSHPVLGGVYPMPRAASELIQRLPPPSCYEGPFVMVDKLLKVLETCNLEKVKNGPIQNGIGEEKVSTKRKIEEETEEGVVMNTPLHDIYRSRQQKRIV